MLTAGVANCDITPPIGSPMAAFPAGPGSQPRLAEAIRDRLRACALVLRDEQTVVALCNVDLCAFRDHSLQRLRQELVNRSIDVPAEQLIVAATHTHSGAETSFLFGGEPDCEEETRVVNGLADAIEAAAAEAQPCRLFWGRTPLPITHNRRVLGEDGRSQMILEHEPGRTFGPVDPDLHVLRVDRVDGGQPLAVLLHFTAHPLTLGRHNCAFSADFPGEAAQQLEAAMPGCQVMFLNGAAGNVHLHRCMRDDDAVLREMGGQVAAGAQEALALSEPLGDVTLRFSRRRLSFANRVDETLQVPVEVAMLELGPLCLGCVPGEFFVEHQLRFRQAIAPRPGTLIGYANGWPGYAPTREAYPEGGYGVDIARQDQPAFSRTALPPGAPEQAIEALLALLAS